MKTVSVVVLAMFGLTISIARGDKPKGYRITLTETRLGTLAVEEGDYQVLVHRDESKVEIRQIKTGEMIDTAAKLETAESKFERTEVYTQNVNGVKKLMEIRIGGTPYRVTFPEAVAQ